MINHVAGSGADVELRVPADGAYVYVLRTTAASIAGRLDFTVDDIEDIRIAIGEAASLLLDLGGTGTDLLCHFALTSEQITATISLPSESPLPIVSDSFAWQVLSTLATECDAGHADGRAHIRLALRSTLAAMDVAPGQAAH
ncbi:anti-sigma factor [Nocardioides gilvus]|uniref:anti-sigma factor n=1 Tax=Nocardioides gilvus TaxID=1735589 RepID=UPI000D7453EC|nr:anti-sigma factor [Nocardioides gilvus]